MIRITIYCLTCRQVIDATVTAQKGRLISSAFEDAHALEACLKEEEPDGQDEGSPETSTEDAATTAEGEPTVVVSSSTGKVH